VLNRVVRRPVGVTAAATVAGGLLLLLSACAVAPAPLPGASESGAPTPTVSASASPDASPTPEVEASIPLELGCADLISADTMFAFNPNFAALAEWTPEAGTPAAAALAADGVACRWVRESGGASVDLAASRLGDAALAAAIDAATGSPVDFGDEAYFSSDANERGTLVVFSGSARLVLSSVYFGEAGDATVLVESALAALN
tara:strand:+ start:401 stop:1006 length:606 start_codon:yes stop_codon:yes gene_type:complete